MRQKLSTLLFTSILSGLSIAPISHAESQESSAKERISNWISPPDIALEPILLSSEQLDAAQIEELLQTGGSYNEAGPPTYKGRNNRKSSLEKYYEERSGVTLDQFGYNLLVNSKPLLQKTDKTLGEVQDTYILGSGDEISVTIRGQENLKSSVQVSSDGQLIIEDLAPISAAGRTIKNVREELQSLLGDYYNTDIFLSLTKTKQLNIRVTGNVTTPGDITLSSYDTVMDALIAAGGVSKTGTLRQIKIIRGNSSSIIDLYGLLGSRLTGQIQ